MVTLEQKFEALVDDALDTCLNDSYYLKSVLQDYFERFTEEQIDKAYADAFDYDGEKE